MLQGVGASVKLQPLPFNSWLNVVANPLQSTGHQLTENLWIEDYPDPYDYTTLLLRHGQNYDIGGFNNPAYNKLVDKAAVEANPTKRAQMYEAAQHIALSQGAWISIGNANGYALLNPKVHGFVGSEAFGILVPRSNNWANISIG
jgi:ABC-type transport system substrate-binding protein